MNCSVIIDNKTLSMYAFIHVDLPSLKLVLFFLFPLYPDVLMINHHCLNHLWDHISISTHLAMQLALENIAFDDVTMHSNTAVTVTHFLFSSCDFTSLPWYLSAELKFNLWDCSS